MQTAKAPNSCHLPLCSSVLPVPFAFSRMGVLLGVLTMAAVAYSNSLTSVLLLRAAGLTGHDSYEGVAQAVGGRVWKVGQTPSYLPNKLNFHLLRHCRDPMVSHEPCACMRGAYFKIWTAHLTAALNLM